METESQFEVRGRAVLVKPDGTRIELPVEVTTVTQPEED